MVAAGLTLALGELLEGRHKPVYQLGSSDSNPCTMRRFFELSGLVQAQVPAHRQGRPGLATCGRTGKGAMLDKDQFKRIGPQKIADSARSLASLLKKAALGPVAPLLKPAADAIFGFARQQENVGNILGVFLPFVAQFEYVFRCDNTRAAYMPCAAEKARIPWTEQLDWRKWFMEVHAPGLEMGFPQIDERLKRRSARPSRTNLAGHARRDGRPLRAGGGAAAHRRGRAVAARRSASGGAGRRGGRAAHSRGVKPGDRVLWRRPIIRRGRSRSSAS